MEVQLLNLIWVLALPLMIWEAVWKAIALWKSARRNQVVWYVCILIFNTLGILPIVYLIFFQGSKRLEKKTKK